MEDDFLDKLIGAAEMNVLEWRDSQPYDGVLGQLAEWVPDEIKDEFYKIRNKLLNAMNYKEQVKVKKIRQWIDEYHARQNLQKDVAYGGGTTPPQFMRDVSYLAVIQSANSLGETDGLPMLVGKMAVIGAKSKNGYKTRADQVDKADFQELAKPLLEINNNIIDKTLREPKLKAYVNKWSKNALRSWLREIRPAGHKQTGRPTKT